jgi:hypothetical protein
MTETASSSGVVEAAVSAGPACLREARPRSSRAHIVEKTAHDAHANNVMRASMFASTKTQNYKITTA